MADLTTVAVVKTHGGISGSSLDTKLALHLTQASRMIERYCDRILISAAQTEYRNGNGVGYISLDAYPVTAGPTLRVATPVLEVRNTLTTTNQVATVANDGTNVTLSRTASGTSSSLTAAISAAPTLNELADDINVQSAVGWQASVVGPYGSFPSARLRATQGVQDALNDTACLEAFVEYSSYQRCDYDTGTVWGKFPFGHNNIQVTYTGGFTTIPDDVIGACCELTLALHRNSSRDATLQSEKLGDYSYTNFDTSTALTAGGGGLAAISPMAAQLLQPFKRVRAL